jgi:predicted alpha/beta-hydrolase family hydrolase
MPTVPISVSTPQGPGRFFVDAATDPHSILVLGHGAGGGTGAADLELLARQLPERGTTVVRFEQPWRTAGRRVAGPTGQLDEAWVAAVGWLRDQEWGKARLFVGGRSAGARVACRTALALEARGVVCLAFPLHLPGRPDRSRAAELLTAGVPRLVLQGTSDSFGTPDEIRSAMGVAPMIRIVELPGADHGFRVAKNAGFTAADLRSRVVAEVTGFLAGSRE